MHALLSLKTNKCSCGQMSAEKGLSHHIAKSALDGSGENIPGSLLSSVSTASAYHQMSHEGDTDRNCKQWKRSRSRLGAPKGGSSKVSIDQRKEEIEGKGKTPKSRRGCWNTHGSLKSEISLDSAEVLELT